MLHAAKRRTVDLGDDRYFKVWKHKAAAKGQKKSTKEHHVRYLDHNEQPANSTSCILVPVRLLQYAVPRRKRLELKSWREPKKKYKKPKNSRTDRKDLEKVGTTSARSLCLRPSDSRWSDRSDGKGWYWPSTGADWNTFCPLNVKQVFVVLYSGCWPCLCPAFVCICAHFDPRFGSLRRVLWFGWCDLIIRASYDPSRQIVGRFRFQMEKKAKLLKTRKGILVGRVPFPSFQNKPTVKRHLCHAAAACWLIANCK